MQCEGSTLKKALLKMWCEGNTVKKSCRRATLQSVRTVFVFNEFIDSLLLIVDMKVCDEIRSIRIFL